MLTAARADLITDVVRRVKSKGRDIGKIQLQKLIYFLQESGIDLGYSYDFYHYGPFSFELAHDMETLRSIGGLDIKADDGGYGYHISPGRPLDDVFEDKAPQPENYDQIINTLIKNFADYDSGNIELRATIHYIHDIFKQVETSFSSEQLQKKVVKRTKELKPKFSDQQISTAYSELENLKLLR